MPKFLDAPCLRYIVPQKNTILTGGNHRKSNSPLYYFHLHLPDLRFINPSTINSIFLINIIRCTDQWA